MRMRRRLFVTGLLALVALAPWVHAESSATFRREEDVIYGRKDGVALTMDVFKPQEPNGHGIIFIVSGGWFSNISSNGDTPSLPSCMGRSQNFKFLKLYMTLIARCVTSGTTPPILELIRTTSASAA